MILAEPAVDIATIIFWLGAEPRALWALVLKDEIAVCGSPRALTVLPAFGTKTQKSAPAGTYSKKYMADKKAVKMTLSWAKVARK